MSIWHKMCISSKIILSMITKTDLDKFSRASLGLYSPELNATNYADHAVIFLRDLVAADMICVAALHPVTKALNVTFSEWDDRLPEMLDGFARTMSTHQLFNFDVSVNQGRPFFRSDFYSRRQFREVNVYKESMALMGWNNHCAVHVPTNDQQVLFLSLERSGTVEYNERDRLILELAQPHLANARRLAHARTPARGSGPLDPAQFELAGFSPRESEVLLWLTEGKTNSEMARLMNVHIQTVKFHLTSIFNKIGAGNRLAATLYALDLARSLQRGAGSKAICVQIPGTAP